MDTPISRRSFVWRSASLALGCTAAGLPAPVRLTAIEPFQRSGPPRLLPGLAAYSFRSYFRDSDHPRETPTKESDRIDMFRFLDFCAEHGCAGAELTSYYFPAEVTDDYLRRVKRHAFLRGVAISGTAIGNTFTHPAGEKRTAQIALTKRWIDRAAVLGAPHIRVFAGSLQGTSEAEARTLCLAALEECAEYAGARGIVLGIENHGGIVAEADALLEIVRAVKSPWVGINLDTGNFHTADPYGDIARCAPYAVNVQLKTEIQARGGRKEQADLGRLVRTLREARYQGYVTLEYEAAEDPRTAVPRHLAEIRKLLASG